MRIFRQAIVNTAGNNTANITDLVSLGSGEALQAAVDVGTLDYIVFGIERD